MVLGSTVWGVSQPVFQRVAVYEGLPPIYVYICIFMCVYICILCWCVCG
jgi:hypothetical protein